MSSISPRPVEDPERLEGLEAAGITDLGPDPAFERLTRLACRLLDTPVSLVSLLDGRCQRFLGSTADTEPWRGLEETPFTYSFCRHAVESGEPLVVEDAREDARVQGNPAVRELGVVAYAGIPLVTSGGLVLGTICAIEHEPRAWTDEDLALLEELAGLALARIELKAEEARRRHGEAELAEREVHYRALVENLDQVITVLAADGTVRYESASIERILGYDPDELTGSNMLELIHPDDRADIVRALGEIHEEPRATRIGEVRFRHADGGWRPLDYTAKNLLEEPAVEGIVVVSRDVSTRKALERQARQAERLDALGRLAGGVAHDFNNVLAAIQGSAGLAADVLEEDHPAREDVDEVLTAAERGARLTRQLLTFSRGRTTERTLIDPSRVIGEMTDLLRRLAGRDIELVTELDGDVPPILADQSELEQVVLNLVVNARDATPERGRVTVRVSGPEPLGENTVPVEQQVRDAYVVLEVTDTGSGIPPEVRDRIFEPLFTTKPEGKGTGLGLSTVYGVVVRSGGRIGLRTGVGEGTTFSVYLPVADEGEESGAEETVPTDGGEPAAEEPDGEEPADG
ncbi:MAG: ATP-binding protein [Longimicrobiales bacterium]